MADKSEDRKTEQGEESLEEMFAALDGLVARMESTDVTLEDSFTLYNQGMEMLRRCNEKIDAVEKKVMVLDAQGQEQEF
ncbi:exodeoxyribonuclease VII small subunit [Hespellia stercorisuis]|uniref:Exodeoxyribonuclease 7 small subunit n=1 Tax=Hespellia stercorisuis DSM 15480 TaxID=1121950 RepID=A0A1M6HN46_9FIRM|nr:exodeoxyribonuclease VII small subunit [Hespellia stercorisuis]SHJ23609.1 Exodeoxyribonuclease VII small subunit [Hespellia stercorisuis DSM 15480]